jgi:FOG: EAL domain
VSKPAAASALLLMLCVGEESARRIESSLRNHGLAVRVGWSADRDSLRQALAREEPGLLLIEDHGREWPPTALLRMAREMRPDTPVVLLSNARDGERLAAAMAAGAHDLAAHGEPADLAHLEQVILRALDTHRLRQELREARQQLDATRSRHQQLTAGSTDAIAHIREGILVAANPAFSRLVGVEDPTALEGLPLMDLVMPEQQAAIRDRLRQALKGRDDDQPLELALRGPGGAARSLDARLILGEEDGERTVELIVPQPDARESEPAAPLSRTDFCAAIDQRRDDPRPQALLLLRIDGFAALEERIGPVPAGQFADTALAAVDDLLESDDRSLRLAPDERLLHLRRDSTAALETLAESLRQRFAQHIAAAAELTRSVDSLVALLPLTPERGAADAVAELIGAARKALSPPDQLFRPGRPAAAGTSASDAERQIADEVRQALETDAFDLAFQAVASLEGDAAPLHDVLLRLRSPAGEKRARDFIPAATAQGLMPAVDRWVVRHMLALAARGGSPRQFLVKLAEETLAEAEDFLDWLRQQPLPPREGPVHLAFELREGVLQNHMRQARRLAAGLEKLGLGLAIEHFGTGSHSAQILDHLPLRYVKFHPDFIRNFGRKDQQAHLSALLEAARAHGVRTIVSFVEDANLLARLWQMGVNHVQGYEVQEPEVVLKS